MVRIEEVRAMSTRDPVTHCWNWLGAKNNNGHPIINTIDYTKGTKRTMFGARAVWQIAHECEVPSWATRVFRCCGNGACVNPAHLRLAKDTAEMFSHLRRAGYLKGTGDPVKRRAAARKGHIAMGQKPTDESVVRAIKAAPPSVTGVQLARELGVTQQVVSRIRTGRAYAWLE